MHPTQRKILEHLRRRGPATLPELSRTLALSPVTIRHHLETLRREGMVGDPRPRRKDGPGRPQLAYPLARRAVTALPHNHEELLRQLLSVAARRMAPPELTHLLKAAGRQMGTTAGEHLPLERRARWRAVEAFLDARGYLPVWEGFGRPRLLLRHCPYLDLPRTYPSVCAFDTALIEALVAAPVEQHACLAWGQDECAFRIDPQAG
jgi:DeoR family suf operon transcriptional repressor